MVTEAQKKATNAYRAANVKNVTVKFFPADREVYDWIQDIVTGGKSTSELAEVLRSHAVPTSRP